MRDERPVVLSGGTFLAADQQIVLNRVFRKHLAIFRNVADAGLRNRMRLAALKVHTRNPNAPATRRGEARQRLEGRGLAGPIASQQRRGLAFQDGEAEIEQNLARAIEDVEALGFDDRPLAHA